MADLNIDTGTGTQTNVAAPTTTSPFDSRNDSDALQSGSVPDRSTATSNMPGATSASATLGAPVNSGLGSSGAVPPLAPAASQQQQVQKQQVMTSLKQLLDQTSAQKDQLTATFEKNSAEIMGSINTETRKQLDQPIPLPDGSNMPSINAQIQQMRDKMAELQAKKPAIINSNDWGQLAETVGHALVQMAAGAYGLKTNTDLSGIKFDKTDWELRLTNRLKAVDSNIDMIAGQQGIALKTAADIRESVTAQAKAQISAKELGARAGIGQLSQEQSDIRRMIMQQAQGGDQATPLAAQFINDQTGQAVAQAGSDFIELGTGRRITDPSELSHIKFKSSGELKAAQGGITMPGSAASGSQMSAADVQNWKPVNQNQLDALKQASTKYDKEVKPFQDTLVLTNNIQSAINNNGKFAPAVVLADIQKAFGGSPRPSPAIQSMMQADPEFSNRLQNTLNKWFQPGFTYTQTDLNELNKMMAPVRQQALDGYNTKRNTIKTQLTYQGVPEPVTGRYIGPDLSATAPKPRVAPSASSATQNSTQSPPPPPSTVEMIDVNGKSWDVPKDKVDAARAGGMTVPGENK